MEATLIKPTVGEGASIGNRVDCNPYTIIEVSSDLKTVTVQECLECAILHWMRGELTTTLTLNPYS